MNKKVILGSRRLRRIFKFTIPSRQRQQQDKEARHIEELHYLHFQKNVYIIIMSKKRTIRGEEYARSTYVMRNATNASVGQPEQNY